MSNTNGKWFSKDAVYFIRLFVEFYGTPGTPYQSGLLTLGIMSPEYHF